MDGAEGAVETSVDSSNVPAVAGQPPANPYLGTKHRVKINGKESEIDYNELVSDYQTRKAADERFKSAKQIEREAKAREDNAREAFEAMQRGDLSLVKKLVPKNRLLKFAEEYLGEYVEYESMDPKERELLEERRARKDLENRLKERDETDSQREARLLEAQAHQDLEKEMMEAVESLSHDYKVTPRLVIRIAEQMQAALLASQKDPEARPMPAKVAAERASQGMKLDVQEYLARAKPEVIIAMLPPKLRDAIRQADVNSVISQMPSGIRKQTEDTDQSLSSSRAKKKVSVDEFFSNREKRFKN